VLCPRCSVTSTNAREPIETAALRRFGQLVLRPSYNPLVPFQSERASHISVKSRHACLEYPDLIINFVYRRVPVISIYLIGRFINLELTSLT